ncbi:hypothetical protein ACFSO7_13090 [Bacillus sp. CGMCC 1.16607]|uniref:hypothetical protein n=1 Tax=Bacillus sp. CGMCC 1.16607 TaxID=3351842 RepID=UPI003640F8A6
MFSIIAFSALFIAIVSTSLAIKGNHRLYWLAAIGIYIFSCIAGFSIGQLTVSLTFVLLALAIGHSFHLVRRKWHNAICVGLGLLVGVIMILFVDDYWLFFPLTFFI